MLAQPPGESCEHRWLLLPNRPLRAWLGPGTPFPQPRGSPLLCRLQFPIPRDCLEVLPRKNLCSRTVWMRAGKSSPAQPGRGHLTRPAPINLTFIREAAGSNFISREALINHRLKPPR